MLTVVFAETALELVPKNWWKNGFIQASARKRRARVSEMLLDAGKHYPVMRLLEHGEKRGRPDIAHDLLKLALDSSLNKDGGLRVFMHTYGDKVISIAPETRIPRSYNSFCGLVEDLFRKRVIESDGTMLLKLEAKTLCELLEELKGVEFIVFDARGKQTSMRGLIKLFEEKSKKDFCVVIGGFPHGAFLDKSSALDGLPKLALGEKELTAPAVLAKVLSCREIALEKEK